MIIRAIRRHAWTAFVIAIGIAAVVSIFAWAIPSSGAATGGAARPSHCATYYIAEPDKVKTQALIYFTFCGPGIRPGRWSCPVKRGSRIEDARIYCRQ